MSDIRIPPGALISYFGDGTVNDRIVLASGSVADWSILVSATHFRVPPESGSDSDNAMMEVEVFAEPEGNGWRLKGGVRWRRGTGAPLEWDRTSISIMNISWIIMRKNLP